MYGARFETSEILVPQLTHKGRIAERIIKNIPSHLGAKIEEYVIMPNHIHLIAVIEDDELRAIRESPLPSKRRSIISKVVGYIKMKTSKEIHRLYGDVPVWQRGYYDHIICSEKEHEEISKYMYFNPSVWQFKRFYCEKM